MKKHLQRPLVVGTLTAAAPLTGQLKLATSAGVDVIELRLDSFLRRPMPHQRVQELGRYLIRAIKARAKLPVLLTLRAADESGPARPRSKMDDRRRAEILARLLPSVEMVDVEIRHAEFARRVTVIGHIHGAHVIHSAHDFKGPGNLNALTKLAALSMKLKGDIFKVAVSPRDNNDLEKFLMWGRSLPNKQKVLIGMGPVGLVSRVAAFSFGSVLTYGHLGRSAAPGQMPVAQLVKSIKGVYGAH